MDTLRPVESPTARKLTINSFNPFQAAKLMGVMYFLLGSIVFIPMAAFMFVAGLTPDTNSANAGSMSWIMMLFMPFIYGAVGFIATATACALYNIFSKFLGGIEIQVSETR